MRKISLPNLVASDAGRARRAVTDRGLVNVARMRVSVQISVSVKMRAMVARGDMDATWVFQLRKMNYLWTLTFYLRP
jgi:hypothetical protein